MKGELWWNGRASLGLNRIGDKHKNTNEQGMEDHARHQGRARPALCRRAASIVLLGEGDGMKFFQGEWGRLLESDLCAKHEVDSRLILSGTVGTVVLIGKIFHCGGEKNVIAGLPAAANGR